MPNPKRPTVYPLILKNSGVSVKASIGWKTTFLALSLIHLTLLNWLNTWRSAPTSQIRWSTCLATMTKTFTLSWEVRSLWERNRSRNKMTAPRSSSWPTLGRRWLRCPRRKARERLRSPIKTKKGNKKRKSTSKVGFVSSPLPKMLKNSSMEKSKSSKWRSHTHFTRGLPTCRSTTI